ncbi:schlafen family member 13-like [Onychomys torridus]|uniref:schlafen family member 13-like n=1 Tax=Onychomys torridus TaxID=38674 RepID=UPI00167FA527|nr:schlafen family member 13-like [Onychomys torridus]
METNLCLEVIQSHPDLVIRVKEVTLGEVNRNKMDSTKRKLENTKITKAACALLNSGGGVIEIQMANNHDHPVEMGLDLEQSLRELIQSSDLQTFFETQQRGNHFYIFVKSWSCSPRGGSAKPRICSKNSSLYCRSGTSVIEMNSIDAFTFLKERKSVKSSLTDEGTPPAKRSKTMHQNNPELKSASEIFQCVKLEYGQALPFPESTYIEFKQFSTKKIQNYIKNIIPEYVSAFANTLGGYLFIGVDDKSKRVLGCPKDNVDCDSLERVVNEAISKLPVFHFCSSEEKVSHQTRVIDVFEKGNLHGYLCVIKVEPFCCAVFSEDPTSWMVEKEKGIYNLTTKEWIDIMMDAGPEAAANQSSSLRSLCEDFESQLSISNSPPRCRPVYSKKGLEDKVALQKHLFSVSPERLTYTPESLWEELCSEHERLKNLMSQEMSFVPCGLLIISRSWAVDMDLEEKQGVICDALLIAKNSSPILYTILEEQDEGGQDYCTHTAFTLKQKLVNTGGYTGWVCVMSKVICLSSESNVDTSEWPASPLDYPCSYKLANTQEMEALLQALVIVLLNFRSFLSDQLGCEILNLLTAQQYEIFSKNLRKAKKLFVHGLPGSGKTIMAMKIMEKIRNTFHCETDTILYICENQRLRNFIGAKNICQAVTRTAFMRNAFKTDRIQHIIVDEAQNFRTENGNWYNKARFITQRNQTCPGILWIFLDYFQTSHTQQSGLPSFSCQDPKEELTKVVRNADRIAVFLQKELQEIRNNPPLRIPPKCLKIINEFTWAQGVSGTFKLKHLSLGEMVIYVADRCNYFLRNGYSPQDIAVLFSTEKQKNIHKGEFLREMRKKRVSQMDDVTFDSIRRFSGLERTIVFGIDPHSIERDISHNLLLCLASRARKYLYILRLPGHFAPVDVAQ